MKNISGLFLILFFALVFFWLGSTALIHDSETTAGGPDPEGAKGIAIVEKSARTICLAIVVLSTGFYFLDRLRRRESFVDSNSALLLTRSRFCPKCGKPLRKNECGRTKQLGLIPRLLCPDCRCYVEESGARIFLLGFVLLTSGLMGMFFSDRVPGLVLVGCFSGPV